VAARHDVQRSGVVVDVGEVEEELQVRQAIVVQAVREVV
jgi:hypothetical protein